MDNESDKACTMDVKPGLNRRITGWHGGRVRAPMSVKIGIQPVSTERRLFDQGMSDLKAKTQHYNGLGLTSGSRRNRYRLGADMPISNGNTAWPLLSHNDLGMAPTGTIGENSNRTIPVRRINNGYTAGSDRRQAVDERFHGMLAVQPFKMRACLVTTTYGLVTKQIS